MTASVLYIAMSLRYRAAQFEPVTEPVERGEAVRAIRNEWNLGRLARLVMVPQNEKTG